MSSKKYIGIGDDRSPVEKLFDTGASIAGTGMGLVPLAVGARIGFQNYQQTGTFQREIRANASLQDMNKQLGRDIIATEQIKREIRANARREIASNILTEIGIEDIVDRAVKKNGSQAREELRALMNSLSAALDDPDVIAEGGPRISTRKQDLLDLMERIESTEADDIANRKQIISEITQEIADASGEKGRSLMNFRKNLYGEMSGQLASAIDPSGIETAYNPINLTKSGANRASAGTLDKFSRVQKMLQGTGAKVEMIGIAEDAFVQSGKQTGIGQYIRITQRGRDPILLAADLAGVRESANATVVRTRAGVTSYAAPSAFMDANFLNKSVGSTMNMSLIHNTLISSNRGIQTYEDFAFDLFEREVQNAGGFERLNANKYFQKTEQFLDQVYRARGVDGGDYMLKRAQLFASQAKIIGMEGLERNERKVLVSNMAIKHPEIFEPFANISASEENLAGGRFTSVGIKTVPGVDGTPTFGGVRPTSVTQEFAVLPHINRVIDPLTARMQQRYNTTGQFVNSMSMFLIDFSEGAMEKLGFGEGQGYVMNQSPVQEVTIKSVMSGSSLKRDNSIFLNELIERAKMQDAERRIRVKSGSKITIHTQDARKALANALKQFGSIGKDAYDELLNKGTFEFSGRADAFKNQMDAFFSAYGSRGGQGIALGLIDDRIVTAPQYTGLQGIDIGVSFVAKSGGREIIKTTVGNTIGAGADFRDIQKFFSSFGKLTGMPVRDVEGLFGRLEMSEDYLVRTLGEDPGKMNLREALKKQGIQFSVVDVSTVKKSTYSANLQMASAFSFFKRGTIPTRQEELVLPGLYGRFKAGLESNNLHLPNLEMAKDEMKASYTRTMITSILEEEQAAIKAGQAGMTADQFGKVFAGLASGEQKMYGFSENQGMDYFKSEYNRIFGQEVSDEIVTEIGRQKGIAFENTSPGPNSTMNRRNIGKTSARTTMYLEHRLKSAGFSDEAVSDFMFSYLSRRTDMADNILAFNQLGKMGLSMAGNIGAAESVEMMADLERVHVKEFMNEVGIRGADGETRAKHFLEGKIAEGDYINSERFKKGFILDFSILDGMTDAEKAQMQRLQSAMRNTTHADGGMFIAGGREFMDSIGRYGTDIEKTEGVQRIEPTYVKRLNTFAQDLITIQNTDMDRKEDLIKSQKKILTFKEEISKLFGESFHRIAKGELAGSSYVQAAFLQFDPSDPESMKIIGSSKSMDKNQQMAFKRLFEHTELRRRHSIAFLDTEAFLSSFASTRQGLKSEFLAERLRNTDLSGMSSEERAKVLKQLEKEAGQEAKSASSKMLKAFFMGTHEVEMGVTGTQSGAEGLRGVESMQLRNPDLGPGHQGMTLNYRNLEEIIFDENGLVSKDEYFERFKRTSKGKKAIEYVQHQFNITGEAPTINSFQDLIRIKQESLLDANEAIERVYHKVDDKTGQMVIDEKRSAKMSITRENQLKSIDMLFDNLNKVALESGFAAGEGGGRTLFVNNVGEIHYSSGRKRRMDFNLSGAMVADADGDIIQVYFPSKKSLDKLRKNNIEAYNKYISQQAGLTTQVQHYKDAADRGMKNMAKDLLDKRGGAARFTVADQIAQDILKEHSAKNIGSLDVTFGALREAAVSSPGKGGRSAQTSLLSMLVSVQEAGNIKAKKLDFGIEFETILNKALRNLIRSEGASKGQVRDLLAETIFRGTANELGEEIVGLNMIGEFDEGLTKSIQSEVSGMKPLGLDELVDEMARLAKIVNEQNLLDSQTVLRTAKMLEGMSPENRAKALHAMTSHNIFGQMASAGDSIGATADKAVYDIIDRYSGAAKKAAMGQRSFAGPLALGALGSMALSAMLGYQGYSAEPMLMPGEISDGAVGNAIRNRSIYDNMSQGPSPEELIARQNNVMMDRPINNAETRVELMNGFSINGQAVSMGHGQQMMSMAANRGGRGHMTINDTRMPITRNYINAILGE